MNMSSSNYNLIKDDFWFNAKEHFENLAITSNSTTKKLLCENNIATNNIRDKPLESAENDIAVYIPKDSIEVLNELKKGLIFESKVGLNKTIIASVKIDGNIYYGSGKTESIAKQTAAEFALKDLMFDMIKSTMTSNFDCNSQYNSNSWRLLGSFAMYKLVEDWLLYYMSNSPYKNIFDTSSNILHNKDNKASNNSSESSCNNIYGNKPPNKKESDRSTNENKNTNNSRDIHDLDNKDKASDIRTYENKNSAKRKEKNLNILGASEKKVISDEKNLIVLLNALLATNLSFVELRANNSNKPPFTFSLLVDNVEYIGEPAGNKKEAKQNAAKKVLIEKCGYKFTKA